MKNPRPRTTKAKRPLSRGTPWRPDKSSGKGKHKPVWKQGSHRSSGKPRSATPEQHSPVLQGIRINRYLAQKGYATRRGADELIEKQKVFINGRLAKLGDRVEESDEVHVKNTGGAKKVSLYFAYNKPQGVITHSPQGDETDIQEEVAKFPELAGTFPVGRLDKDSHGLIILTNDGRITDRLLNPKYEHEKEYVVKTKDRLREGFAKRMETGVTIEDYVTKPCKVRVLSERSFAITLTEGKKHQIRRMVAALHGEVADLKRIRIMNVTLGNLTPGSFRAIKGKELEEFLKAIS